jgi:hypothetical protein|nr:MAG TPA: hypothetical protein [Caudoviricetes sp.]
MNEANQELRQAANKQIEAISPLKIKSNELLERAKNVKVETAADVKTAKEVIKDITAHKKSTEELRKNFTRQLDDVKKQFISAERDILAPAEEARGIVANEILAFERAEEEKKKREAERVWVSLLEIKSAVAIEDVKTLEDVEKSEKIAEERIAALNDDAKHPLAIAFIGKLRQEIAERKIELAKNPETEKEEAEQQLEIDKAKALAEKMEAEAKAAARAMEKEAPKTGSREKITVEIVNANEVPRELCVPSESLIKDYVKKSGADIVPGCIIKRERVI